ncbi:hypothetical protein PUN28_018307 [Cardiocondyla obscurior]|uniref:Uncharacterized protein n=1 Tax=Cardiocondyla obscurior TaxID=286306 RepID=A0AAW2EKN2_9HYME
MHICSSVYPLSVFLPSIDSPPRRALSRSRLRRAEITKLAANNRETASRITPRHRNCSPGAVPALLNDHLFISPLGHGAGVPALKIMPLPILSRADYREARLRALLRKRARTLRAIVERLKVRTVRATVSTNAYN